VSPGPGFRCWVSDRRSRPWPPPALTPALCRDHLHEPAPFIPHGPHRQSGRRTAPAASCSSGNGTPGHDPADGTRSAGQESRRPGLYRYLFSRLESAVGVQGQPPIHPPWPGSPTGMTLSNSRSHRGGRTVGFGGQARDALASRPRRRRASCSLTCGSIPTGSTPPPPRSVCIHSGTNCFAPCSAGRPAPGKSRLTFPSSTPAGKSAACWLE
jgi:hypothetical protein